MLSVYRHVKDLSSCLEFIIMLRVDPQKKHRSKAMLLLWIVYVISVNFCYAFVRVCLLMPCGHLLGKG